MKSAGVTGGSDGIGNRFAQPLERVVFGGIRFPFTSAAQDRIGSGWRFLAASSMTAAVSAFQSSVLHLRPFFHFHHHHLQLSAAAGRESTPLLHRRSPGPPRPAISTASTPGERARVASAAAEARAPATRWAYAAQWALFDTWCAARATARRPSTPVIVAGAARGLEPGVELAAGHGVGAAGVGRRRALKEPDRGPRRRTAGHRARGVTGLAGGARTA